MTGPPDRTGREGRPPLPDVAVDGGPYDYAVLRVPLTAGGVQDVRTTLTGSVRPAFLAFPPVAPAT